MSPTGPKFPGTVVDAGGGGGAWTNPANAAASDGVYAVANIYTSRSISTTLKSTNYSFAIPATAVVDGIMVEFLRYGTTAATDNVTIYSGVKTATKLGTDTWPLVTPAWVVYGGSTDTWGQTWTATDINATSFGASLRVANSGPDGGSGNVDAFRITVYWHTAPTNVPKSYIYKVFRGGAYLGNLPNVTSDFSFSQDINTCGSQISVKCAVSPDTSVLPNNPLLDEAGNAILDESSNPITDEGALPIVGPGTGGQLIRNGNRVVVYEYGYWNPNGKPMFSGVIQRIEGDFGGGNGDDQTLLSIYADGSDMDSYPVRANPFTKTLDQSQTAQNGSNTITSSGGTYNNYGQTFTVGGGVTNIVGINLLLNITTTAAVTVGLYTDSTLTHLLASCHNYVTPTGGATEIPFTFGYPAVVVPGQQYFFSVSVDDSMSAVIYSSNANPYAGGQMYNAFYGGGGGGSYAPVAGSDLYFKTYSGVGSTTGTFTNVDPTYGMLVPIMNDYIARGGLINSALITATGLSVTSTFNTNTTYEGIQTILTLCPYGFYYYVDLGTNTLHFQQANTVADVVLTKGVHIGNLHVVLTIEQIVNSVLFTGGQTAGVNLYRSYQDATSIANYGPHLDRPANPLVTAINAADAIGKSEIAELKNEQYQTTVDVLDHTMDISTLKPGMVIGFNGYGTFVDYLLLEIVRVQYTPEVATLTLGILPKRLHKAVEQVIRGVIGLNTVANPSAPS